MNRLDTYRAEWARLLIEVLGDPIGAERVIEMAEINGLFDPLKVLFSKDPCLHARKFGNATISSDGSGHGTWKCQDCGETGEWVRAPDLLTSQ